MEKGEYKKSVIAINNMTQRKIELPVIAELLAVTPDFVSQVQKELLKEAEISGLLQKNQTPAAIAKKLMVNEWLGLCSK